MYYINKEPIFGESRDVYTKVLNEKKGLVIIPSLSLVQVKSICLSVTDSHNKSEIKPYKKITEIEFLSVYNKELQKHE